MATPARDKYYLRTLHEEIDLFDRKLAHMLKYDSFANDAERKTAANKMTAKREQLAKTARQMAEEGIEFKPSELPRSFRPADSVPDEAPQAHAEPAAAATPHVNAPDRPHASAYDGSALDFRNAIADYIRNRKKA